MPTQTSSSRVNSASALPQVRGQFTSERVHAFGTIQGDDGDAAAFLVRDVGHGLLLSATYCQTGLDSFMKRSIISMRARSTPPDGSESTLSYQRYSVLGVSPTESTRPRTS